MVKQNLVDKINKFINIDKIMQITKDLVEIESDLVSKNEYEVGEYLFALLKNLGLKTIKQHVVDNRYNIISSII